MNRTDIIKELKEFFDIQELVCPHTFNTFGEKSWQFFDRDFLEALLILRRDVIKKPLIANNWQKGGPYSQRGLRCNICDLTRSKTLKREIYLTAHANGAGIDVTCETLSAEQMRQLIKKNADKFPMKVRIEKDVTWLHFDVYDDPMSNLKITEFKG